MYCARRRWWLAAGVVGALTSATRAVGIIVWPVLVLEWLRSHGWSISAARDPQLRARLVNETLRDLRPLLAVSLTPVGLASYVLFLNANFQQPLAFWTAQALWRSDTHGPLAAVLNSIGGLRWGNPWIGAEMYWQSPLDLAALAIGLGVGVSVVRTLGPGYGLFTVLGVLIPAWSYTDSMLRYVVVLFPVFMMLGRWGRRPLLDRSLSTVMLVLLGVCTAIFVNWSFLG
jgi:hypothetical protein